MAQMAISSVSHQRSTDSIGADSVGASGTVDLANKMDKIFTKISTDPTPSSTEISTVSKTEDNSSADVRQKHFPLPSSELFALGYIDINSSYASPMCRLSVFVKESVCGRARVSK